MTLASALVGLAAFLIGSIPFSFLVARAFGVGDVRQVGSGNVGATNVMRSAGKLAGGLAFLLDFGKGVAATSLGGLYGGEAAAVAAVAAILGHMYPPWLKFQGGKGVATGVGAFLPIAPRAVGLALLVFPVALALTRHVSVGSLLGTLTLVAAAFAFEGPVPAAWAAALAGTLIFWRHRANLQRLAAGTESRLGRPTP